MSARLLVVDDEPTQREMLSSILARAGFQVETAANGIEALARLEAGRVDLLLTDERMGGMDGLELLERARALVPGLPVVLMTAYGSVNAAVAAMKRGAADYLTKPFERDELLLVLERALAHHRLEQEVRELRSTLATRYAVGGIVGRSAAMQEVFSLIDRVAPSDASVLICGESGTGKELVARAIHQGSRRGAGPFVALNCAAVPESLLESEFFGHERGAFTGALKAREGRFEQADGGTLFLDEIGAMRIDLQAKLLRVLQERVVERLGSGIAHPVDVRLLAATGENLAELIAARVFREDLYYRLNVVEITLPPLRERAEDVPLLVARFLAESAARLGRKPRTVSTEVLDRLQAYPWPGNVRELQNAVERMTVLAAAETIGLADLPPAIRRGPEAAAGVPPGFDLPPGGVRLGDLERHLMQLALERTRGNLGPAARLLGISYKTLQYRIRKHGLEKEAED